MKDINNSDTEFMIDETTLPIINQIAEEMPGGFFIYYANEEERLIYANKSMLRIFGCKNMEEFKSLTGFTFKGIVHPDDLESVEKSIYKQISNNINALDYVEYRIIRNDGSIRWVEDYGHFVHTEVYGDVFYVFIEDATERMKKRIDELEKINKELRAAYAAESQYKRAILHDSVSFFEVNLMKDEFTIKPTHSESKNFLDMFQYKDIPDFDKYSDYIKYCLEKYNRDDIEKCTAFFDTNRLIRSYEKGELEQSFETYVTDSFGTRHLLRYTFLIGQNKSNKNIMALSITKDISEQLKHQRLLKMALSQANAANIARATFLSNMSHDIITPLNSIIGYTDLICKLETDNGKILDYLNKIKISSNQLLTIANESLEITRMESGKAILIESKCNILDILNETEKLILPRANAKNIRFLVNKSKIKHFCIIADFIRIREILCQLLYNSIKYTPQGGEISLSVEEINDAPKFYGKYKFIVRDSGIGISESFMDKIFEPFERENNTTKSGVFGSGLGLAVTKCIVDMMDGTIEVESIVGKGSCFTVTLLFSIQEEQHYYENSESSNIDVLKGKRLLLVEDNEINMEIAKELLTDCGFFVDTAYDGSVAVEMLRKSVPGTYDVVLMDIQMPVMDGYEATKAIRSLANPRLANIPIIAVSANAFAEDQEKSLEAGMNAHFPKPINIKNLCELIGRILKTYDCNFKD